MPSKALDIFVPCETLLTIYNALVQPHFNYCSVAWDNCNIGLSQKLQNRAARIITFSNYDVRTDELFRLLNWNKLNRQRMINKSILMYKVLNNETSEYLSSWFINRMALTSYNLRNTEGNMAVPLPRTDYYKRSFSYSGAVL